MAGTKKTKGAIITWTNANINTNYIQGITGALLNQAFLDLYESIFFGTKAEDKNVTILYNGGAGTNITFAIALPTGSVPTVLTRSYDANGDGVAVTIDPALVTNTGFNAVPAIDGKIDYVAITTDV